MAFTTKTNTSNNSGPHGAYVRFAVRPMCTSASPTAANTALQALLTQMDSNINSTARRSSNIQGIFANAQYEIVEIHHRQATAGRAWTSRRRLQQYKCR